MPKNSNALRVHDKLKEKIKKEMAKNKKKSNKKSIAIDLLDLEQQKLQNLLDNVYILDKNQLNNSIKSIRIDRNNKLKQYKLQNKLQKKNDKMIKKYKRKQKKIKSNNNNNNNMDVDDLKNDNNNIDSSHIYLTNGEIKKCGRAIAISLNDASLIGNAKNKHMTILFRRSKKWTQNDIDLMNKTKINWIKQQNNNNNQISFNIEKYGRRSVKIKGDLENLCLFLRNQFSVMSNDRQRPPHVELFR